MNNRMHRLVLRGCLALALSTTPAWAQGNGKGKGKGHDKSDRQDKRNDNDSDRAHALYGFRPRDREIVTAYYSKRSSGLPPGLAKRGGDLPPGLEKQLQQNGTLPPGLQKKLQPCPFEITRELPPLPADYQRGIVGANIVIFNRKTNIIVDVMANVVR